MTESKTPMTNEHAEWLRYRAASPYFAVARLGLLDAANAIERLESAIASALAAKERAEAALAEHKHSFDLRWQADQRARALWRKDRPDRDMIWPDHADLCVWLLEQRDALAAKLAEAEKDAARYRWLRANLYGFDADVCESGLGVVFKFPERSRIGTGVNLDAAIDAAISQALIIKGKP